jgi:hypothetical protein
MWDWVLTHRAELNAIYRPAPAGGRRVRVDLNAPDPAAPAGNVAHEHDSAENPERRA